MEAQEEKKIGGTASRALRKDSSKLRRNAVAAASLILEKFVSSGSISADNITVLSTVLPYALPLIPPKEKRGTSRMTVYRRRLKEQQANKKKTTPSPPTAKAYDALRGEPPA